MKAMLRYGRSSTVLSTTFTRERLMLLSGLGVSLAPRAHLPGSDIPAAKSDQPDRTASG